MQDTEFNTFLREDLIPGAELEFTIDGLDEYFSLNVFKDRVHLAVSDPNRLERDLGESDFAPRPLLSHDDLIAQFVRAPIIHGQSLYDLRDRLTVVSQFYP